MNYIAKPIWVYIYSLLEIKDFAILNSTCKFLYNVYFYDFLANSEHRIKFLLAHALKVKEPSLDIFNRFYSICYKKLTEEELKSLFFISTDRDDEELLKTLIKNPKFNPQKHGSIVAKNLAMGRANENYINIVLELPGYNPFSEVNGKSPLLYIACVLGKIDFIEKLLKDPRCKREHCNAAMMMCLSRSNVCVILAPYVSEKTLKNYIAAQMITECVKHVANIFRIPEINVEIFNEVAYEHDFDAIFVQFGNRRMFRIGKLCCYLDGDDVKFVKSRKLKLQ